MTAIDCMALIGVLSSLGLVGAILVKLVRLLRGEDAVEPPPENPVPTKTISGTATATTTQVNGIVGSATVANAGGNQHVAAADTAAASAGQTETAIAANNAAPAKGTDALAAGIEGHGFPVEKGPLE